MGSIAALICPIGTTPDGRSDLLDTLVREINAVEPELVVFIVSRDSRSNAEYIAREAGLPADRVTYDEVDTVHDLNLLFVRLNETIRSLVDGRFRPEQVAVNYTSGTKVMATAAVLAAIFNGCGEARYIFHEPNAQNRTVSTRLEAVFAHRDLHLGRRLIEETRYRSAFDVLSRIETSLLAAADLEAASALKVITVAYYEWDNFNYSAFVEAFSRLQNTTPAVQRYLVGEDVLRHLTALAAHCDDGQVSEIGLADMVNNAVRRMQDGRFDDAVARLYRALEMLAQWALLKNNGIDTDDVDTRRIPPRDRVSFEAMRSMDDGTVRIGMRKAYELLTALGHPLGGRYHDKSELVQLVGERRNSILAHGTRPLSLDVCTKLHSAIVELITGEIAEFPALCAALQFPWIQTDRVLAGDIPSPGRLPVA